MHDGTVIDHVQDRWAERPSQKQRAAVQREVVRLLDALAPVRAPARPGAPTPDVQRHRLPRGCVLQGAERAVSVSWFPAGVNEDSFGELQLISWSGNVSLPGATRKGSGAVALSDVLFKPVAAESGAWSWIGPSGPLDTDALIERCRELLDGQLPS